MRKIRLSLVVIASMLFSFQSQAAICHDIYDKVNDKGCVILNKVPKAKEVCTVVNGGAEQVCKWCAQHPNVCLTIAGMILGNVHPNAADQCSIVFYTRNH